MILPASRYLPYQNKINWANPLTRGLVFAWVGGDVRDLVSGFHEASNRSTSTPLQFRSGLGYKTTSVGTNTELYWTKTGYTSLIPDATILFAGVLKTSGAVVFGPSIGTSSTRVDDNDNTLISTVFSSTSFGLRWEKAGGAVSGATVSVAPIRERRTVWAGAREGTGWNARIFQNGVYLGTGYGSGPPAGGSNSFARIGTTPHANDSGWIGEIDCVYIWNRALTDIEIKAMSNNTYRILT